MRTEAEGSPGRILRSLVEPPPPEVEDTHQPVRRGRKPGSKNKPKPQSALSAAAEDLGVPVERPRRGRKPGSKNKPKAGLATSFPAAAGFDGGVAAAMRSYGFADDGTVWQGEASPSIPQPAPAPSFVPSPGVAEEAGRPRSRLRDRSAVLRRYVLDIEPRPGQPGALRARRLARTPR